MSESSVLHTWCVQADWNAHLVILAPPLVIREEDLRSALALLERLLLSLEWS